ncbi:MAG: hypothetical protein ACERKZ_05405 [Lachnotalea sp.]
MEEKVIKLAIGFATGRKNFRKVMNSYIYSWNESGIVNQFQEKVSLNLFVAYDVNYSNTISTDYTNLNQEIVDTFDDITFIGANHSVKRGLSDDDEDIETKKERKLVFGNGYAGKRNVILYEALKNNMDYLLFLDDDEYPLAVTNNKGNCLWSGQYVLPIHLENIKNSDITNGYHCGYISPIPKIKFDEVLTEDDFGLFVKTISNDIINWESIKKIMKNGGVTYADTDILVNKESIEVEEVEHCKFISGANLCINLTKPERTFPFYNPPGARGEDTFLSTLLTERKVTRVPCYTFHDGFSAYRHLLDGTLPIQLDSIIANSDKVVTRFYSACLGWIRYKPLLLYITNPSEYEITINEMRNTLTLVLPKLSSHFNKPDFMKILDELNKADKQVKKNYQQYLDIQTAWRHMLEKLDQ